MSIHPPEPLVVHPLPPAPHFVGREAELESLRALWKEGFQGVLALVGLGGAGKTAVAARFLQELLGSPCDPRPGGIFVWSFYLEPDAGLFLRPKMNAEAPRLEGRSAIFSFCNLLSSCLTIPKGRVLGGKEADDAPTTAVAWRHSSSI